MIDTVLFTVSKLAQATVTEQLQKMYDRSYKGTNFKEDRWYLHKPANYEIIQVKPNWHNSMDVVGYLSNIPSPHYVFTPFVNFIVKAWTKPNVPFFLCLDEMNLAPVEEYFAEFLSAIESRSFENGEYKTDPIIKPFNEFGNGVAVAMINELNSMLKDPMGNSLENMFRLKGLSLPKNLIVIGTVNMDETTFSFSRKVLDRAMSIEMNEVDYGKFILNETDDDMKDVINQIGTEELNNLLVNRHIEAREVIGKLGGADVDSDAMFVISYLDRINKLFDGTPFKLGYRVSNDALLYLASAKEFGINDNSYILDDFTLMKILSRIEGDESKLKITTSHVDLERLNKAGVNADEASKHGELTILTALREIINDHLCKNQNREISNDNAENDVVQTENQKIDNTVQNKFILHSIQKIDNMISQLERDHFVSYWN